MARPVPIHEFRLGSETLAMLIDHRAHVDDDTELGEGTKVWQFASVIRGAVLGPNCVVGACANIDGARLGSGCRVGHGASLHPGLLGLVHLTPPSLHGL